MMNNSLYPLKFAPIYKSTIWGGSRIGRLLHRANTPQNCGESWDISGIEGSESVVENGFLKGNTLPELIEVYMGDLVGEAVYDKFGLDFPLLVKVIDAQDDLSIQVHPGDEIAAERHNSYGKTEMWYVMDSEPGAGLINGFCRDVSSKEFSDTLESGSLLDIVNKVQVSRGDIFMIPSGTLHTICKGCMVAEIQQSSDITYRIYDYGRTDSQGRPRELHAEMAMGALSLRKAAPAIACHPEANTSETAVDCKYFTTNVFRLSQPTEKDFPGLDSFIIYMCVGGKCAIECDGCEPVPLMLGESALVPACISSICFNTSQDTTLLEIYIKGE